MKYVLGGNWKLQINTSELTRTTLVELLQETKDLDLTKIDIFLSVPYTLLSLASEILEGSNIKIAAQNVHFAESGAFTGEISVHSLKELGVEYVLIGHSERRLIFKERDLELNKKIKLALKENITPVFCLGETAKQRAEGKFEDVIGRQLDAGLQDILPDNLSRIVIAYEPVWAINNPLLNPDIEIQAATPDQAQNAHHFIRNWLADKFQPELADQIPILYGGSMKQENAEVLLRQEQINGGLIGGASLKAKSFVPIIQIALNLS